VHCSKRNALSFFPTKRCEDVGPPKCYELAVEWLIHCGLIHRIARVSKPAIPLKSYEKSGAFKLFAVDIGLLSAMSLLNV
jgi:hypothetical protein